MKPVFQQPSRPVYTHTRPPAAPILIGALGNLVALGALVLPVYSLFGDEVGWFSAEYRFEAVVICCCALFGVVLSTVLRGAQVLTAAGLCAALGSAYSKMHKWSSDPDLDGFGFFEIFSPGLGSYLIVSGAALSFVSALYPRC